MKGGKDMRSGFLLRFTAAALFAVLLAGGAGSLAHAGTGSEVYYDAKICDDMKKLADGERKRTETLINNNFPPPGDLSKMFCLPKITENFSSIGSMLGGAIFGQFKSLIDNLMNQVCQATMAPFQAAGNMLCIPSFNFNLDPNFNFGAPNSGVCNGTPLFSVQPAMNNGYGYSGGSSAIVVLP